MFWSADMDAKKIVRHMQTAYDRIAPVYADRNSQMPPNLAAVAVRFLQQIGSGGRILDLSCGAGRDMAWFECQGTRITGADLSTGMLAQARSVVEGPLIQMDVHALGLRSGSFHGVWYNAALLHLPKSEAPVALREVHRILTADGTLFLSVQKGEGETWETDPYTGAVKRFFSRYQASEIAVLLNRCNFTVCKQSINPGGKSRWISILAVANP